MKPFQTPARSRCIRSLAAFAALAALSQVPLRAQTAAPPSAAASAATAPMGAGSAASSAGSQELHRSMTSGMDRMHRMQMTGDADKDFAAMMKMHHQQAVEMAQVQLRHGKSPQLKAMARKMVKDQTREIEQLDAWMRKHP